MFLMVILPVILLAGRSDGGETRYLSRVATAALTVKLWVTHTSAR
jgi:hypothetical protein